MEAGSRCVILIQAELSIPINTEQLELRVSDSEQWEV